MEGQAALENHQRGSDLSLSAGSAGSCGRRLQIEPTARSPGMLHNATPLVGSSTAIITEAEFARVAHGGISYERLESVWTQRFNIPIGCPVPPVDRQQQHRYEPVAPSLDVQGLGDLATIQLGRVGPEDAAASAAAADGAAPSPPLPQPQPDNHPGPAESAQAEPDIADARQRSCWYRGDCDQYPSHVLQVADLAGKAQLPEPRKLVR